MARPKQTEPRGRQFNVSLTEREHEVLLARAAASGLRPVDYGRAQLFARKRISEVETARPPHLDPLFHAELSRLGNLLNQIVRKMHIFDQPAPPELVTLLDDIRALINEGVWRGP
jgi:hypothetical protein